MMKYLIKGRPVKVVIAFVLMSFVATTSFAFDTQTARIMPTGKVLLHQNDQLVGELSSETPLPLNTDLVCEGNCGVKLDGLYLVALDKANFAIASATDTNRVLLQLTQGSFYFQFAKLPYPLVIKTPDGDFSIDQISLNASTGSNVLEGAIVIDERQTEIGVTKGGSMVVTSQFGSNTITQGNQISIAPADENATTRPAGVSEAAILDPSPVAMGIIFAAAVGGVILLAGSGGGTKTTVLPE